MHSVFPSENGPKNDLTVQLPNLAQTGRGIDRILIVISRTSAHGTTLDAILPNIDRVETFLWRRCPGFCAVISN